MDELARNKPKKRSFHSSLLCTFKVNSHKRTQTAFVWVIWTKEAWKILRISSEGKKEVKKNVLKEDERRSKKCRSYSYFISSFFIVIILQWMMMMLLMLWASFLSLKSWMRISNLNCFGLATNFGRLGGNKETTSRHDKNLQNNQIWSTKLSTKIFASKKNQIKSTTKECVL